MHRVIAVGLTVIVLALALVVLRVWFASRGEWREGEALVAEYKMRPDRFLFTGPVPDEDLAAYYRTADVYVSLSEHEGFCVPLLEAMAAERLGMEAALLVVSGTMGNVTCALTHCARGEEAILGDASHIFLNEAGGISALGGIFPHTIPNLPDGTLQLDQIEAAIRADNIHFPRTRLICLENSHNRCYGAALTPDYTAAVVALAKRRGVAVHLDGARIFNAAVALGVPAAELGIGARIMFDALRDGVSVLPAKQISPLLQIAHNRDQKPDKPELYWQEIGAALLSRWSQADEEKERGAFESLVRGFAPRKMVLEMGRRKVAATKPGEMKTQAARRLVFDLLEEPWTAGVQEEIFSLIELMISMVISMLIAGALAIVFLCGVGVLWNRGHQLTKENDRRERTVRLITSTLSEMNTQGHRGAREVVRKIKENAQHTDGGDYLAEYLRRNESFKVKVESDPVGDAAPQTPEPPKVT